MNRIWRLHNREGRLSYYKENWNKNKMMPSLEGIDVKHVGKWKIIILLALMGFEIIGAQAQDASPNIRIKKRAQY